MKKQVSVSTLRGSLAAATAVVTLAVVIATAAIAVPPLLAGIPAGTEVAPADLAGLNLLEPVTNVSQIQKTTQAGTTTDSVERVVGQWTPTGGPSGGGGGGSGKLG